jgi:tripartite-type tricarboxylate transporter receptor subunit TctC
MRCAARFCILIAVSLAAVATARGQSVEEFYRGKNINLLVGFTPGGGYDLYARLLARHIGRHIPGQPTIVVQNMPGAGSLRSAQFLYTAAPKDGTTIATFSRQMGITPLLQPGVQFDGTKLTWLGSISNEVSTCVTWHTSRVKTWNDLLEKPVTLGGDAPGADPDLFALLYKNVFDAKVKLVSGYHGTSPLILAMERGEVDGLCGLSWSTIKSRHLNWFKEKKINVLVQAALKKEPDLADVPLVIDMTKTAEQRQIIRLFVASQETARPFAAPPNIPADRKTALIAAFEKTMKDPEFLADAQRLNVDINPVDAKTIDSLLADLYATPKNVIEKAAQAVLKQ